jgi:hypothetical protein
VAEVRRLEVFDDALAFVRTAAELRSELERLVDETRE